MIKPVSSVSFGGTMKFKDVKHAAGAIEESMVTDKQRNELYEGVKLTKRLIKDETPVDACYSMDMVASRNGLEVSLSQEGYDEYLKQTQYINLAKDDIKKCFASLASRSIYTNSRLSATANMLSKIEKSEI